LFKNVCAENKTLIYDTNSSDYTRFSVTAHIYTLNCFAFRLHAHIKQFKSKKTILNTTSHRANKNNKQSF